jgi:hypothetical protein
LQIAKFTPRNFDLLKTTKKPLFTGFVKVELTVYKTQRAVMKGSKKSLSLRLIKLKPADFQRVLFFSSLEVPFEVPFFFYESLT